MIRPLLLLPLLLFVAIRAAAAPPDPILYGRAFLAEGDYAASAQSFADALRQNPNDAAALNNMGVAKAVAGDYQAALELVTRAERLAPQRNDIRENLAHLLEWTRTYGTGAAKAVAANPTVLPEPPAPWSTGLKPDATVRRLPSTFSACPTLPCK